MRYARTSLRKTGTVIHATQNGIIPEHAGALTCQRDQQHAVPAVVPVGVWSMVTSSMPSRSTGCLWSWPGAHIVPGMMQNHAGSASVLLLVAGDLACRSSRRAEAARGKSYVTGWAGIIHSYSGLKICLKARKPESY
jgi:hypothetical protein